MKTGYVKKGCSACRNYPALTGACALGERILNYLILNLRDDFHSTPEYKQVYRKDSFDQWDAPINALASWGVLLPEVAVSTCIASTIDLLFIGCFALARTATATSIWLIFFSAGFDSLAVGFATAAFFLVALVVVVLLAALALRLVLVAVLVAMFVFPCFEICVSRWRNCQRWSHSYL